MTSKVEKRLVWHPRKENKFIVGGGSQIILYEWAPDVPEFRLITSQSDIQHLKCFAWSSDPKLDDLVAVGTSSGKIELMRLEVGKVARNLVINSGVVGQVPVRSMSRSCNALSFSPASPNLLAVGLDKVRGDSSLVVWDVTHATSSNTSRTASASMVQQYAAGEAVSSVSFLPELPHQLVAGVSGRCLRLFDLRNTSVHTAQAQCVVQGIAMDPFDPYRFASYEEGTVSIWDSRKLHQQLLSFTMKDASADGARYHPNDVFSHVEFSCVRRDVLASLVRDSNHVRFWDIQSTPPVTDGRIEASDRFHDATKESSRSRKLSRLSWATPSTILPWSASADQPASPTTHESSRSTSSMVLSNTHRTKSYNRSIVSFTLVPDQQANPLTSKIVVVNRDGDIEMHAMQDAPKHTVWSSRGDLTVGAGNNYRIYGLHEPQAPPEPWEIELNAPADDLHNGDPHSMGKRSRPHSRAASPGFGRGDRDGFPALVSTRDKSRIGRTSSPTPNRFPSGLSASREAATLVNHQPSSARPSHSVQPATDQASLSRVSSKGRRTEQHRVPNRGRKRFLDSNIPSAVENDITPTMRARVLLGYGLMDIRHNAKVLEQSDADNQVLSGLWTWCNHAKHILGLGVNRVHGFDFAYQGVLGIWEGLEATSLDIASQLDSLDLASTSGSPSVTQDQLPPGLDVASSYVSSFFSPSRDALHGNYVAALNALIAGREGESKGMWKPSVHSVKMPHRKLALALIDFKIGDEEFSRWEREGKHPQAACWLLFTNQGGKAIDLLMRSKTESHQMMSGTLAVLLQAGSSSKNQELHEYCQRLVVKLQDPHFRIMVSYVVFNDWSDVMEEEALSVRERLAIALRFLDDKSLASFLKRTVEICRSDGNIEGLLVTGLTPSGLDILQSYVDMVGDVQTAALLCALVCPIRYKDVRGDRWIEAYQDLLDGWKLFHYRCQFDIDRGRFIQEDIQAGSVAPMEWTKKQFLIRCYFCQKVVNSRSVSTQRRRAAACPWCGRALPRCSVCLMSIGIIPDTGREVDRLHSSFRDTLDDAFMFCQACRHGGHAAHLIEWFFGDGDEARARRTCPIADCDCYCGQEY